MDDDLRRMHEDRGERTEAAECSIPPDDAVGEAFRRRRRGELPDRMSCQTFENSAHAAPAAVFGGHWGIRMPGAFRLQPIDEEPEIIAKF
jgi:hypothetical protein